MPRKKGVVYAKHPQRNYCYGALEPSEGLDLFWSQVRLKHRYRNRLVELELERRQFYHDTTARYWPLIENLQAWESASKEHLGVCEAQIQANKGRRRSVRADPELALAAKLARQDLSTIRKGLLKPAKEEMKGDVVVQKVLLDRYECAASLLRKERDQEKKEQFEGSKHGPLCATCFACRRKIARAESGLFWGNYLEVERSQEQAGKGPPPRFLRFPGEGYISTQIQNGMTLGELLAGEDPRARMTLPGRSKDGRRKFGHLSIRLGDRGTVTVPVVVHRDMPPGTLIKWIHVHVQRVGTRYRWSVRFAIASPDGFPQTGLATSGHVGVNLGWRLLSGERMRVAYAVGDDGQEEELIIPPGARGEPGWKRWVHADSLRATADEKFNSIRDRLIRWLRRDDCPAPEWMRERFSHLHLWRSPSRLAATLTGWWNNGAQEPGWNERRFKGDKGIHADVLDWLERCHKHYTDWAAHERLKAQRWREDLFRVWVAKLRARYRTVHLGDVDWRQFFKRPLPESTEVAIKKVRYLQRIASPGRLSLVIAEGFPEIVRHEPEYTTLTCHGCGNIDRFDAMGHLIHTCSACGSAWDQDQNAARNLLALARNQNTVAA